MKISEIILESSKKQWDKNFISWEDIYDKFNNTISVGAGGIKVRPEKLNDPVVSKLIELGKGKISSDDLDMTDFEQVKNLLETGISKLWWSIIKQNCSDIVSVYKTTSDRLYRGSNTSGMMAYSGESPIGRAPINMDTLDQGSIDKFLQKAGFTALRHNSIFTTSDTAVAKSYGHLYTIFPVNGFTFTCNTEHSDLFRSIERLSGGPREFLGITADTNYEERARELGFIQDDIKAAMNSATEIYVHGRYYAIRTRSNFGTIIDMMIDMDK